MSSLLSKSFDTLKPHLQFYGYGVSREWLIQFAEQHCPEELPDHNDIGYKCMATMRAYELIADLTTINTLDRKLCFNLKGGFVPPEWIAVYDGDSPMKNFWPSKLTQFMCLLCARMKKTPLKNVLFRDRWTT
ncbi:hypothetical protein BDR07DRAFT_1462446 [Suillus spraguei]|nr:hypothetical protein BDR07DRAFT_1462446 [Suillus spraguei]